jgi:tetratricopeptide (TPR) repeat protein
MLQAALAAARGGVIGVGLALYFVLGERGVPLFSGIGAVTVFTIAFGSISTWLWIMGWPEPWSVDFLPVPWRRAIHLAMTVAGVVLGAAAAARMTRSHAPLIEGLLLGTVASVATSLWRGARWLAPARGSPSLVDRGLDAWAVGNSRVALACYGRAIALDATYSRAYHERAALLLRLNSGLYGPRWAVSGTTRPTAKQLAGVALSDLDAAIRSNPGFIEARLLRAECRFCECGRDAPAAEGERARRMALDELDEAIRLDPTAAAAYHQRGLLRAAGSAEEMADFDAAIRLDPGSAKYHVTRGRLHLARADYDRAIADFNEALRLNPDEAWVLDDRAAAYRAKGDYGKAEADKAAIRRRLGE